MADDKTPAASDNTPEQADDKSAANSSSEQKKVQVIDVSHPGKSAPSATSRPVIVGSGSYMKDPMVSQPPVKKNDAGDDNDSPEKKTVGGGRVIAPLHDGASEDNSSAVEESAIDAPHDAKDTTQASAEKNSDINEGKDVKKPGNATPESAVVDAVLGQVDEKGNTVDQSAQTNDDRMQQLIREKKYFVSISKPKQSHLSMVLTALSIIVIIVTIIAVANQYDVLSLF